MTNPREAWTPWDDKPDSSEVPMPPLLWLLLPNSVSDEGKDSCQLEEEEEEEEWQVPDPSEVWTPWDDRPDPSEVPMPPALWLTTTAVRAARTYAFFKILTIIFFKLLSLFS